MPSVAFGQTLTGRVNKDPYYFAAKCSALGTILVDGSTLICKAGGTAWFVSPPAARPSLSWANGNYNDVNSIARCCVSEWGVLVDCLENNTCCYRNNSLYSSWFVPSCAQFNNPMSLCRCLWNCDGFFWTSNCNAGNRGRYFCFDGSGAGTGDLYKYNTATVITLKCVTY